MRKGGHVYIITNKNNTTLYIGVTSHLLNRIFQHRNKTFSNSFSAKYNLEKLMYYQAFDNIQDAIGYEKKLKKWGREDKLNLINSANPEWKDLFEEIEG